MVRNESFLLESRHSKSATTLFQKAFQMSDVAKAVNLIGSLVNSAIEESQEVSQYNTKTGKPEKHEWVSSKEKWDGRLWLSSHHMFPSLSEEDPLYKLILGRIPLGETLIVGKIAVTHVPSRSEEYGTMPAHLLFIQSI